MRVKLRWQDGANTVDILCEVQDDGCIAGFDLRLTQNGTEHTEIPGHQNMEITKLQSYAFQKNCRSLREIGETMQIGARKE